MALAGQQLPPNGTNYFSLPETVVICGYVYSLTKETPENPLLKRPVDDFPLSMRACNAFRRLGVQTLKDVESVTERSLKKLHGIGKTTMKEITNFLDAEGVHLKEEEAWH